MLVDSHCHLNMLDLSEFNNNLDNVIAGAQEVGVEHMLCVSVALEDVDILKDIVDRYTMVSMSVGVHPDTDMTEELDSGKLLELASYHKCIAIGETGLDYYRQKEESVLHKQRLSFCKHIDVAKKLGKPLIIHTRQASEDTINIMSAENAAHVGGVMHCFTESWEVAKAALDLDFYISFSGIVTFKNATSLHEVAKKVPLDRMLIETDSPYLAPVPFRGKQNHPALVEHVAQRIAELRGLEFADVALATTNNFYNLFRLRGAN